MSLFALGEPVQLRFQVSGLTAADAGLTLLVDIVDEHDRSIRHEELAANGGAEGVWSATLDAPADRLGFYRARVRLSNGVELPKLGTRAAGFITYAVVPDPNQRPLLPERETRFGMQGGAARNVNVLPYLGVRWILGGYAWKDLEPTRPGEIADKLPGYRAERTASPPEEAAGQPWVTYPMPTPFFAPQWATTPDTLLYCTGTLTPEGETAWRDYCIAVAHAFAEDQPDLEERIYQITWEPVYPWGFKGTDEDLIRIYEIAYPAIHEGDPRAVVVGPTGAGIRSGDVEWNQRLLSKGIWRYLDAYSIHPYHPLPPERLGLVERVRELRELIRQYAGRDMDLLGTEQGWPTGEDPANELQQAQGLLRENLIMLGEGLRLNFGFYLVDYFTEPGYGYHYNLNPNIAWGTDKIGPKPISPAYAFQSFLLEGHRSAGAIEWLGDTALGYGFERGEDVVLALWDYGDEPRPVTIPVGVEQIRVADWMGNAQSVEASGGNLSLTLGPEPVYVLDASPAVWGSGAEKPVQLSESRLIGYPGGHVLVAGDVASGQPAGRAVYCEVDPRLGQPRLSRDVPSGVGTRAPFEFDVPVPADVAPGQYPVRIVLSDGTRQLGLCGAMLSVRPPVEVVSIESALVGGRKGLRVRIRDSAGAPQEGTATVRLVGEPGTRAVLPFALTAQGAAELEAPLPDLSLPGSIVVTAQVQVTLASGYEFRQSRPVNFTFVPLRARPVRLDGSLEDWPPEECLALAGREAVIRAPQEYRGAADLSARVWFAWDEAGLYLAAEVTDDTFLQPNTGYDTWKGDCIQLGYDLDPGKESGSSGNLLADAGNRHRAGEIDLALTPQGPQAFRTIGWDAERQPVRLLSAEELPLSVTRAGSRLLYEATIPWATLGLAAAPAAGDRVGIALAVNDMDRADQPEPKALGLFGGITPAKDPARFGVLVLEGKP